MLRLFGCLEHLDLEPTELFEALFERHDHLDEHLLRVPLLERDSLEPPPVSLRPRFPLAVIVPVPKNQFTDLVTAPEYVLVDRLSSPHQISQPFPLLIGNADQGQFSRPIQPTQLSRIPLVG